MIINVRGTSGSGKSTLIKAVMELYKGPKLRLKREGRKQPTGYLLMKAEGDKRGLFIPGHYEVACGGCDTLSGYEESYSMIREADTQGHDVLYEGLLISGEAQRPIDLHTEGRDIRVVVLTTSIDECIASINARRQEKRGPDAPPVKEKNTRAKARAVELAVKRMTEAGIQCIPADRAAALDLVRSLLVI